MRASGGHEGRNGMGGSEGGQSDDDLVRVGQN